MSGLRFVFLLLVLCILPFLFSGCSESADAYKVYPAPGARDVPQDVKIRVNFSHSMETDTVNGDTFLVYGKYYGDHYSGTIQSNAGGSSSSSTEGENGQQGQQSGATEFTFQVGERDDGGTGFLPGEEVTVHLTKDIIGTNGIPYDGKNFTFYVAGDVPDLYLGPIEVVETVPSAGSCNVPQGTAIKVRFSRKVKQSSVSSGVTVMGSWGGSKSGKFSFPNSTGDLAQTAVFVPEEPFLSGEPVTVSLSGSVAGEDPRDKLAPYTFSFTYAAGSVGPEWMGSQAASELRAERILSGQLRHSQTGLEAAVLDRQGFVYIFSPADQQLVLSEGFSLPGGEITSIAVSDLFLEGEVRLLASALFRGKTRVLFLRPQGGSLVEDRDALEVAGSYGAELLVRDFTGDAVPDILLAGESGLLLLKQQAALGGNGAAGLPGDLQDLLEGGQEGNGGGTADQQAGDGEDFSELSGVLPSVSGITEAEACDLNSDGRLDLLLRQGGSLGFVLWEEESFGAVRTITPVAEPNRFAVMHLDGDRLPEVVIPAVETDPILRVFPGTPDGPGEEITAGISLPVASSGRATVLTYDLTGDGVKELLVGAPGWSDFYTLYPEITAEGLFVTFEDTACPGTGALDVVDYDGDSWPELFAGTDTSIWVYDTEGGAPPPVSGALFLREENVTYEPGKDTVKVVVTGKSAFDFDGVKICVAYPQEKLEFAGGSFPENSYFSSQTANLSVCSPNEGCQEGVIATLTTNQPFNIHEEVKLVSFRFRPAEEGPVEAFVRLQDDLEDESGETVDNAFRTAGSDYWIPAGIPLSEVVVESQGPLLELSCSLQRAGSGQPAGLISWDSPSESPLPEVTVRRNGDKVHEAAGAGSWSDSGIEEGLNLYEVTVSEEGAVLAEKSCELIVVPSPVIDFCGIEDDQVVLRWHPTGEVDGFSLYRDGATYPYKTFGPGTNQFSEENVPGGAGHLYSIAASLQGVESPRVSCESVIGGEPGEVTLPGSFSARAASGDPFAIELSWVQGTGYEELALFRNGEELTRLGLVTSLTDAELLPGTYNYELRAVAQGSLQDAVSAEPVTLPVPECSSLTCSFAGDFQIGLNWENGSAPYDHFVYDKLLLQRKRLDSGGNVVETEETELAPEAGSYTDTVSGHTGTYRYVLFAGWEGELYPKKNPPTCEISFATELYPEDVTVGAGMTDLRLPIKAKLVGTAEKITFNYWYRGGDNRLSVTGYSPGPSVSSVQVSEPEARSGGWLSTEVVVEGPVEPGEDVLICELLAETVSDFALYGYDREPPSEEKRTVETYVTEIRVHYPGEDIWRDNSTVRASVKVSCRYLFLPWVDGLAIGDTFSLSLFGTFERNLVGFTVPFSYDTDSVQCLGATLEETETPRGLFAYSDYDNEAGVGYVAWIAQFQPEVFPVPSGFHRLIGYLQFEAVGPAGPGEEVSITEIEFGSKTHEPLLTPSGWVMGDYLEAAFGSEIEVKASPEITGVSPSQGPIEGGSQLRIEGKNFGFEEPVVWVGSSEAQVIQHDGNHILCTVPPLDYSELPVSPVEAAVRVENEVAGDSLQAGFSYVPLSVSAVEPDSGPVSGGNEVRVVGEGIPAGIEVFFASGQAAVTSVDRLEGSYAMAEPPPSSQTGAVDVVLRSASGQESTLEGGYTYTAGAPEITQVTPDRGPSTGGTTVTVEGANFVAVGEVRFGTSRAQDFTVVSPARLEAVSPPGEGTVDLVISTEAGQALASFKYEGSQLQVSGFTPQRGSYQGGTQVTVSGQGFQDGVKVFFGEAEAPQVEAQSSSELTALSPAGTGQIQVKAGFDRENTVAAPSVFVYEEEAASITGFQPRKGPASGGNTVEITGDHFIPQTKVYVAGAEVAAVYLETGTITVSMPPGTGKVSIEAENPGTVRSEAPLEYEYESEELAVSGMTPASGSRFGDTEVRLEGQGFFDLTKVFFGGEEIPKARITVVSGAELKVQSPPHEPGGVEVSVQNPDGDPISLPGEYVYEDFAVDSLSPAASSICGGAEIILSGTAFHSGMEIYFGEFQAQDVSVLSEREARVWTPSVPEGTGEVSVTASYSGTQIEAPSFVFTGVEFVRGDTSGDGAVALEDAILLTDFLHGLSNIGAPLDAADVDDNGLVNAADVYYLYNYLWDVGSPPQAPFPDKGTDPTPDSLTGCARN